MSFAGLGAARRSRRNGNAQGRPLYCPYRPRIGPGVLSGSPVSQNVCHIYEDFTVTVSPKLLTLSP